MQADYEENVHEGIFLVRPENTYIAGSDFPSYLASEDLAFFACIEEDDTPVRLSALCADDNNFLDIPATKWGPDNCFIGSVNLNDFDCHNAILTADYVRNGENERLTKEVQIDKVTGSLNRLLQLQYEDGGWSSSLDTAYVLFSIKPFANVFKDQTDKALMYLKNTRNDENKCWPADKCQVSTTATIAYLLTQAEYDDSLRIIQDSTVYLHKSMSYIDSGETWTVRLEDFAANLNNSVNTSCVYAYDAESTTFNLSKYGRHTNLTLTPQYASVVNVVCTENIYADIFSSTRGKLIHYEGDNLTYTIPGPCWTFNNENVTCDLRTTAFAIGTPISDERKVAASQYLNEQLTSSVIGTQFADGDIMNTALLTIVGDDSAIATDTREELVRYLLFKQTNLGSWNTSTVYYNYSYYEPQDAERANYSHVLNDTYSRNIVYTAYAVEALLSQEYDRSDEPIRDAERWVSLNELSVTPELTEEEATDAEKVAAYQKNVSDIINDPKRNAMALYVLQQHTRPFLKSTPRVIVIDKQNLTLEIVNPTTFTLENLNYEFSPDIQPYLEIETKDYFAPYSFRKLTIRQTVAQAPDAFGYLRITSGSDEYAKIPVIISSYPSLNVAFPSDLTVFGTSTVVALNITKSAHNYSCTLKWETAGISALSAFTIEKSGLFNLPVQFTQAGTEEKEYSGVLSCTAKTSTFTFPFTMRVNRFITKPLGISPDIIELNATNRQAQIVLKNLLDESIDVTLGFRESSPYLDFSDSFITMYPGEVRNITVQIMPPQGENASLVNAVVIKTFNLEERIPLQAEIIYEPETKTPTWILVASVIFGVGAITIGLYFGYSNRKKLYAWYVKKFKKENEYKKIMASVEDYEQKELLLAIKNMTQILKMEGVSEKDIRARLLEQGFTDDEIVAAAKLRDDSEQAKAPKK